jgi:gamma-glutamyl-gamma-aminobutyrate hydrolase PuuD
MPHAGNQPTTELSAAIDGGRSTRSSSPSPTRRRLTGKRVGPDVARRRAAPCNYLLSVDVDLNTVDGYPMSSWETGYGDMMLVPDLTTLRRIPWQPGAALVMADLQWEDGSAVVQSPRAILDRQRGRLAERGLVAYSGTELEFIVFDDSYREAWAKGYRDLRASTDYNVDYNLLATTRLEPLLRDIRNGMEGAGLYCEGVKGECNFGQQEIAFRYAEVQETADQHTLYKNGAKEIADAHGKALTFMAKFNEREGNSCHIHLSVRSEAGEPVMAGDGAHGFSPLMGHWIAGILATMREFTSLRPDHQLLQAVREGLVRADRDRVGHRQPHVCAAHRGARFGAARREPRPGRRREPVPRSRRSSRAALRHRERAAAAGCLGGQRLRGGRRHRCRRPPRGGRALRGLVDRPCCLRRRDGRALSEPGAHRGRGLRRRRDGLGARAWLRTTLTRRRAEPAARDRAHHLPRAGEAGVWDVRAAFLPQQYFTSVTSSGGIAVLLPPQDGPDDAAAAVLDTLDGLILTGGLDVQPELYGADRHPLTDPARPDRDAWELALLRGAEERGIPVLAICRGLQLANVAHGGTLHQHLPEALGTERYRIGGGVFAENTVEVDAGSRLAEQVGAGAFDVHSYHHQGIDRLGDGLVVTARTDDGLVQAFEARATDISSACSGTRGERRGQEPVRRRRRRGIRLRRTEGLSRTERHGARVSTFDVINPATAEPIATLSRASVDEVDAAVARAVSAQRTWAALPPLARADALRAFARVVEDHVEELAALEVRNSGHPISSARWEAGHVAQVLNYYSGAPERLLGAQIPVRAGSTSPSTSRTASSGSSCRGTSP